MREVFRLCHIPDTAELIDNLHLFLALKPSTQKLVRPQFRLDMNRMQFTNMVLCYDSSNDPPEFFNNVDVAPPAAKIIGYAHRTGTPVGEIQKAAILHLNMVNELNPNYSFTPADLSDLYPYELHALQGQDADPHLMALTKIPREERDARRLRHECLICGQSLRSKNGHSWRQCPGIHELAQ